MHSQGFWIAYVRIPPFIVTLAGMLAFRGLSNVVLDGMTVSIKDRTTFVNLFGGGADCYIPDFFGNGSLNMTCIFAGVLAAAIYISIQIKGRMDKVKKGYEVEGLITVIMKMVIITAVILAFTYRLAQHKGIPSVLIWVADRYHGVWLYYLQYNSRTLLLCSGRKREGNKAFRYQYK